ncbi:MAG: histidine kinase [Anaerolineae bacterium]|jgi:signal transduction histidine kinase
MMKRFPRVIRSVHIQLFLWAVLPVTFVIISLSFTGVYVHQRRMRDFVTERDLTLARVTARIVEDGLAHGRVRGDGQGLATWMAQFVGQSPETVTLMVVDADGAVLAHPNPNRVGQDLGETQVAPDALAQGEGAVIVPGDSGSSLLVAFASVGGTGWSVIVQEPVEELIGPILRLSSLAPVVAVGAAVLSMLILTFGWRTIVRPLQQLAEAAEQVSWGDFSAIAEPVGGVQEIHDLHRALADMTERIRGYEAGMRDYLGAMTEGQEAERARLARELHDGPVQELIALGQRAEMAQRLLGRGEVQEAKTLLGELRKAELATVEELRRLIGALRPSYLEDLGFIPALEMLVRQVKEQTEARVILEKACVDQRLAAEVELAAFRIAQEALNNALQHAQAEEIIVRVRCEGEGLNLSVVDDGVGFRLPARPDLLTQAGHFGLMGMRERSTLLGGAFRVDTAPGQGTRVTVNLPAQPSAV